MSTPNIGLDASFEDTLDERLSRFHNDNERWLLLLFTFAISTVPYFFINVATEGRHAYALPTWLDARIPFSPAWEYPYIGFDLFVFLPFLVVRDLRLLRRAVAAYALALLCAYATFLVFPVEMVRMMDHRATGFVAWGVRMNHALDGPFNCFPSIHVAISILAAWASFKADRFVGSLAALYAASIVASTLFLKQHYAADIAGALVVALFAGRRYLSGYVATTPDVAWPRRRALVLPGLYALGLALAFAAYVSGMPVPHAKWDAREIDLSQASAATK